MIRRIVVEADEMLEEKAEARSTFLRKCPQGVRVRFVSILSLDAQVPGPAPMVFQDRYRFLSGR